MSDRPSGPAETLRAAGTDPVRLEGFGSDPYLGPYLGRIELRQSRIVNRARQLAAAGGGSLADFASWHHTMGLHRQPDGSWIFREWAPNASRIVLIGDHSAWQECEAYALGRRKPVEEGIWELQLPSETLHHGMHYRLKLEFPGGSGERIPAFADCVVQDERTHIFSAMVWDPEHPYCFRHPHPAADRREREKTPLIYEAHVGMAQEEERVGSFREFQEKILPRIVRAGYNTLQLMAIPSHPYYGSFGYHVANFFSVSTRFGTPDDFKALVDAAHGMGLRVIMDLVHSHAVRNEVEGLARFDGTFQQYFRSMHEAWDSCCFDYGKTEVLRFLLSNCRCWLEEYHVDGFRFDGVTSMLYYHHGLNHDFCGYGEYFGDAVDEDAYTCLALENQLIHTLCPGAVTIAEDVSGMPGLGAPAELGGAGFDYRMAMGVSDLWFKLFDLPDEHWDLQALFYELNNRRADERTVSYVECHDQALVGGQTAIFRLIGRDMYDHMQIGNASDMVTRGVALHKLTRLTTAATAAFGYLNFMGNEFGHPEWIDFPREGNQWSYHYARRQWHLADDPTLYFSALGRFDRAMLTLLQQSAVWESSVRKLKLDNGDLVMAFERGGLWFFCNFHPTRSYADYGIEVLPGEYELVLDSDAAEFGGQGRVRPGQHYFTIPERDGKLLKNEVKLYLPTRTALVLRKVTPPER